MLQSRNQACNGEGESNTAFCRFCFETWSWILLLLVEFSALQLQYIMFVAAIFCSYLCN